MKEVLTIEDMTKVIEALGEELRASVTRAMEVARRPAHFTRAEAAEYLRISPSTLDRLAAEGRIRRAKLGESSGATVLYRLVDLDAFVEAQLELDAEDARRIARKVRRN